MNRLLVLAPLSPEQFARLAGGCDLMLILARDERVFELRQQLRDFDHVMVAEAEPPSIPWAESFFNRAIASREWPKAEIQRVCQPGASIVFEDE